MRIESICCWQHSTWWCWPGLGGWVMPTTSGAASSTYSDRQLWWKDGQLLHPPLKSEFIKQDLFWVMNETIKSRVVKVEIKHIDLLWKKRRKKVQVFSWRWALQTKDVECRNQEWQLQPAVQLGKGICGNFEGLLGDPTQTENLQVGLAG